MSENLSVKYLGVKELKKWRSQKSAEWLKGWRIFIAESLLKILVPEECRVVTSCPEGDERLISKADSIIER